MSRPIRVGITHGDINGISYEIILKAFSKEGVTELCTPVIYCSVKMLGYYRKALGIEDFRYSSVRQKGGVKDGEVNIMNISEEEFKVNPGECTAESGRAAIMALDMAVEDLKRGEIDVLVTAPIHKSAMHLAGFNFPGHTEYLEDKLGDGKTKALMVMSGDEMKVALVTAHIPLKDVSPAITKEKIEETVAALDRSLRRDYGLDRPTIAVLSLNPHAGDGGVLGSEEQEIIIPAIQECVENRYLVFGPFAADGFFGSGSWRNYDGIVAMYHDQGLAPFKTLAGTDGVNFTANLPYVRTSPDHGTGYDIVGKNIADPTSLLRAVYEAVDIYRARQNYDEMRANPLKKLYNADRGGGGDKNADQIVAEQEE